MSSHPATRRPHNGATKGEGTGKGLRDFSQNYLSHTHTHTLDKVGGGRGHLSLRLAWGRQGESEGGAVANADRTNWFAKQAAPSPASSLPQPPSNCQKNTHK